MQLQAIIERIDEKSIMVEYVDPFGHGNYRLALDIPDDFSAETFEAYVRRYFPFAYLKQRHHQLTRPLPQDHAAVVARYAGQAITFDVPEAPAEPVVD